MDDFDHQRYSRHILFSGIGEEGQRRIVHSAVAIVGCGALGSAQADMLARAGVSQLRLIDRDFVEWSNLQRQTLFHESDAHDSVPKAIALARELKKINSSCGVHAEVEDFNSSNAEDFLTRVDLVMDGSDNFQARYLINDCSVKLQIPWIYGACVGSYGAVAPFLPQETPCLRCLFPDSPAPGEGPTCDTAGIATPLPKMVAAMQVAEALKILAGSLEDIHRALVSFDLWSNNFRSLEYGPRDAACACCGRKQYDFLKGRQETEALSMCGRNSVQILPKRRQRIDLSSLGGRLRPLGTVTISDYFLKLVIPDHELAVFKDGRAIIKGTTDPAVAKSLYARYVGD